MTLSAPGPAPQRPPSPPVARRRLAHQLQAMRRAARLTLDDAAPRLDLTKSSLHRLETGQTQLDVHLARSMMDLYDQYEPGLLDLVRAARARGWWRGYHIRNRDYTGWEAGATHIQEVAALRLPDLLQTQDYTRALLRGGPGTTPNLQTLSHELRSRHQRQSRLTDPHDPLTYTTIIDEAALRNPAGERKVMHAQLEHLVQCAKLPRVCLRVLPAAAGAPVRIGAFHLLSFHHPDDPPIAYIDHLGDLVREERPARIDAARTRYHDVESASLSRDESISYLEHVARDIAR